MRYFILLFFTLTCFALGESSVITSVSSTNLVVGEYAALDITYRDARPSKSPPETITSEGLIVQYNGNQQQYVNGKRFFTYRYVIAPQEEGSFTIPSLILPHKGKQSQSLEVQVTVHSQDVLERVRYQERDIVAYSKLFPSKTSLYPGEASSLEYKVYLPSNSHPQSWGLPKPQQMDNCTAWRFSPPGESGAVGSAVIDGQEYRVGTYSTVLTAIKPGKATFGPIETDLVITPPSVRAQWGFIRKSVELPLPYNATTIDVIDFPNDSPAEFNGAVGDFTIEAALPTKTSISLNESITATVTVEGSGNLPQVVAPSLEDISTWKVIDVSRAEQGDERKALTGTAAFNYILQPQRGADSFPRFTFSHFNPETKQFYTETTETAPLTITVPKTSGTAVVTSVDIPTAQMNDILAPLSEINLGSAAFISAPTYPAWIWQLIPASVLVWMLVIALKNKSQDRALKNSNNAIRQQAFQKLEQADNKDFLKEAGTFIEKWFRTDRSAELDSILQERDNQCYQPEHTQSLSDSKKKAILATIKKALTLTMLLSFFISNRVDAADGFDHWLKGDYKQALDSYQKELEEHPNSADLEYNIGNCYYRLNQPGLAALHFERALAIEPTHTEALKNIRFVQETQGSILPPEPKGIAEWTSPYPATLFLQLAIGGIWITVLCIVAIKVFRPKAGKLATLVSSIVLVPCAAVLCFYAWFSHPNRISTAEGEAGMLTHFSAIQTEPIKFSGKELEKKTLVKATPASPCRIIAQRGNWSYISLANDVRGWTPNNTVSTIRK
jgi:hypothetical protein